MEDKKVHKTLEEREVEAHNNHIKELESITKITIISLAVLAGLILLSKPKADLMIGKLRVCINVECVDE